MNKADLVSGLRARKLLSLTLILFTLAVGVVIGTVITSGVRAREQAVAPGATPLSIPAPAAPNAMSSAFVQVAKVVEPAVVNINTESIVKAQPKRGQQKRGTNPRAPQGQDPFEDFFDRFFGGQGGEQGGQNGDIRSRSLGSGIVVDPKGYILTNRHVVNEADRIRVKLAGDNTQYDAKVIGMDEETDLAVIKIEPKKTLVTARMGNSDSMSVGEWVLAIGSPFGLPGDATVTAGIISARNRDVGGTFQHFLQTDAAINPGNSGGPLVNMNGEVIGVNTAIITSHGSYEGVGFALPSSMAVLVYNQIIKNGRVTRGSIGIEFAREDNAAALRVYGASEGVLVTNVLPSSPAEKAGLKPADVILSVAGKTTATGNELVRIVSETPIGDTVKVRFLRDRKEQEVSVRIGDRSEVIDQRPDQDDAKSPKDPAEGKFGISIQNLNADMASRLNLKEGEGVVVTDVDAGSFAEDIGMTRGDVITEINRQPVRKVEDVRNVQRALKAGQDVVFRILRRGRNGAMQNFFLAGQMP